MINRKRNPEIHDYCVACLGWGVTTVRKGTDYEDEFECLDCGGTGNRTKEGLPHD